MRKRSGRLSPLPNGQYQDADAEVARTQTANKVENLFITLHYTKKWAVMCTPHLQRDDNP
jgi:hypothetical protein